MSLNLGPFVLTVIQFVSAAVGYLLVVTFVPQTVASPEAAVLIGVVAAAIAGSLLYYREVKPRMPASMLGEEDRDPVDHPGEVGDDPGPLGAEDLPGPGDPTQEHGRDDSRGARAGHGDGPGGSEEDDHSGRAGGERERRRERDDDS